MTNPLRKINGATILSRSTLSLLAVPVLGFSCGSRAQVTTSAPTIAREVPGATSPSDVDFLFSHYFLNYRQETLQPMSFQDSPGDNQRAALLVSNGVIRLSLKDAIALAIENNLDVESVRLLRPIARADLARAHSGQLLRNIPSAVDSGVGSAAGTLATATPFGFEGGGIPGGGLLSGLAVQLAGSTIPNTETTLFSTGHFGQYNLPQANTTVTGTNFLSTKELGWEVGLRKGFFTGTNVTASFDTLRTARNAPFDSIVPAITGDAIFRVDQSLLQGFNRRTNMRAVYIARNNSKIADLTFQQQLILTVSQVEGLYYDLVSFLQQKEVVASATERDKKELEQIGRQMDLGLASKSDSIEAQIRVDDDLQALTDAEAQISEQEATIKTVLTHAGLDNPIIAKAHIVPTDIFTPPLVDASHEDPNATADRAIAQRVELKQAEIALTNKQLSLTGTRNALLPRLDLYVQLQSNALAGNLNRYAPSNIASATDPRFIGGFGTMLDQLAHRTYPDYEVGFQLNIPLTNRAAQSDMARDQIDLRQQQISQQALRNGVRLQAIKSSLALRQARNQYDLSVRARKLLEENLATEQKMFEFGSSDQTHLLAVQGSLDRTRIREITSLNTYARASVNLQAVLNETLDANDIIVDEAHSPTK